MLQEWRSCKSIFEIMEAGEAVFCGIPFNLWNPFSEYVHFHRKNAFAELGQNGIFVIIAQMESITFGEKRDFLRQFAVAS